MKKLFNLKDSYYYFGLIVLLVIANGMLILKVSKIWLIGYVWFIPILIIGMLIFIALIISKTNRQEEYLDNLTCLELKKKIANNPKFKSTWIFFLLSYFSIFDPDDDFIVDKQNSIYASTYRKKVYEAINSKQKNIFGKNILPSHVITEFSLRVLSTDKYDQMTITQLKTKFKEL